jgi:hypothetical protein
LHRCVCCWSNNNHIFSTVSSSFEFLSHLFNWFEPKVFGNFQLFCSSYLIPWMMILCYIPWYISKCRRTCEWEALTSLQYMWFLCFKQLLLCRQKEVDVFLKKKLLKSKSIVCSKANSSASKRTNAVLENGQMTKPSKRVVPQIGYYSDNATLQLKRYQSTNIEQHYGIKGQELLVVRCS